MMDLVFQMLNLSLAESSASELEEFALFNMWLKYIEIVEKSYKVV